MKPEADDRAAVPDGPTWLRAAVLLGVPSVIALVLVYWVTFIVDARLLAIQTKVDGAATSVASAHDGMARAEVRMSQFALDEREFSARQIHLLKQICLALARTPAQIEGCR